MPMPHSLCDLPQELLAELATQQTHARCSAAVACRLLSCCTTLRNTLMSDKRFATNMRAARNMLAALWFHERTEAWKAATTPLQPFPYSCTEYKTTEIRTLSSICCVQHIFPMTVVMPFPLKNEGVPAAVAHLLRETDLIKSLDVSHMDLSADETECIAKAMAASSSRVSWLNLSGNDVDDDGAACIAALICDASALADLNLSNNVIGTAGAGFVAKAIVAGGHVARLTLYNNQLLATGASMIAKAMENNRKLTFLDLSYNMLGASGAQAVAASVAVSPWVKDLRLSGNDIGDTGATAVATNITARRSLKRLELSSNCIGSRGAAELSAAVGFLEWLNLKNNDIDDEGVGALAGALASTRSLRYLNLSTNDKIGVEGCDDLTRAVFARSTLRQLFFDKKTPNLSKLKEACLANEVWHWP